MNIPDAAVEAAARVIYASQTGGDYLDTSRHREAWLRIAERALDAAAPFIVAEVFDQGVAASLRRGNKPGVPRNPYRE